MRNQTEEQFLASYDENRYKKPKAMVDIVIFTVQDDKLKVLLIKRGEHPYKDMWALPGGAIRLGDSGDNIVDETLESAALRELKEETGITPPYLEQLRSYGSATRDPREWTLSVAYYALVGPDSTALAAGTDAAEAKWWTVNGRSVNTKLAFDHKTIITDAVDRLRAKVEYSSAPVHLLPKQFTLGELKRVYELLLDEEISKAPFNRRVKAAGIVEPVEGATKKKTRPAQLYRFVKKQKGKLFFPRDLVRYTDWKE